MSNDLQADIAAAIKQHLPAQIGDALRKRLEYADAVMLLNDELKTKIVQLEEKIQHQSKNLATDASLRVREENVQTRERAVTDAEIRREVFETKIQLAAEARVSKAMHEALLGLVRNTEYRSALSGHVPVVVPGFSQNGYNNPPFVGGGDVSTATNTTAG